MNQIGLKWTKWTKQIDVDQIEVDYIRSYGPN